MSLELNSNNLASQNSQYLLAHKDNPIKWYPFSLEALKLAQKEDKPLFISIGYQANHLSDIMNEESFSNDDVAKVLNDHFISIKIDKDECPDLSLYYQLASQVSSNIGGWPLNVFAFSDLSPYFATTYIPFRSEDKSKEFISIANSMANSYKTNRSKLLENSEKIKNVLSSKPKASEQLDFEGHFPLPVAVMNALKDYQDNDNGGYGAAPKLSNLSFYEYAIEQVLEGMLPEESVTHIIKSVENMIMGGIYDHAKGGIHSYSKDEQWLTPQFEKSIYDQATLLRVLIKTSLIYPSPLIYDSIIQTIDYLETEMLSEKKYFFTAQGSSSEGVDGLYFTFSKDEFIDAIIDYDEELESDMDFLLEVFNISDSGNYDNKLNIISLNKELKDKFYDPSNWEKVRKVKMALQISRKERIPPKTDSKGIASYNFQILSALIDVIQYSNIDIISKSAFELLSNTFDDIHKTFIKNDLKSNSYIINSTTNERLTPLFENYSSLLDLSLRFYEISGAEKFLKNSSDIVEFIFDHFFKEDQFFVSSLKSKEEQKLNVHVQIFDQPFKSPLSTFIFNYRKWGAILNGNKFNKELEPFIKELTHLALQNPLAFGESLRALTYPNEAFKILEIPFKWIEEEKIQAFYTRFSSRFAITYSKNEDWSIKNNQVTEVSGKDFESFKETFTNKDEQ